MISLQNEVLRLKRLQPPITVRVENLYFPFNPQPEAVQESSANSDSTRYQEDKVEKRKKRRLVEGQELRSSNTAKESTSVAASVWTLVALSVERYYAICHPLRSRGRQSLSHAYHLIGYVWAGGAVTMLPIPILSELQPTNKGHHKCRESWPNGDYERAYNLFLDFLLLVIPLLVLGVTYYFIATTLWSDVDKKVDRGGRKSSFKSTTGDCYHGEVVFVSDTFDDGSTSIQEPDSFRASVRFAPQERKLLSRLRLSRIDRGPNDSNVKTEMAYSRETENSPPPNRLKRIHSMKSSHRIGEKVWLATHKLREKSEKEAESDKNAFCCRVGILHLLDSTLCDQHDCSLLASARLRRHGLQDDQFLSAVGLHKQLLQSNHILFHEQRLSKQFHQFVQFL
ncbi:hypothetical protein RUM43_012530 [Polyplax serrata]|uniref:G-protein coupled receptors family 1 profile domain-containing protein n=1 Tax=Polyplax serrata TaxID=468196 RepID=A0AAN8RZG2_POLSC